VSDAITNVASVELVLGETINLGEESSWNVTTDDEKDDQKSSWNVTTDDEKGSALADDIKAMESRWNLDLNVEECSEEGLQEKIKHNTETVWEKEKRSKHNEIADKVKERGKKAAMTAKREEVKNTAAAKQAIENRVRSEEDRQSKHRKWELFGLEKRKLLAEQRYESSRKTRRHETEIGIKKGTLYCDPSLSTDGPVKVSLAEVVKIDEMKQQPSAAGSGSRMREELGDTNVALTEKKKMEEKLSKMGNSQLQHLLDEQLGGLNPLSGNKKPSQRRLLHDTSPSPEEMAKIKADMDTVADPDELQEKTTA